MKHITPPLPQTGFLRLKQIIGDPKANPPISAIIPVSKSTWFAGILAGKYPPAIKLSARASAWPVEQIRELIEKLNGKGVSHE